MTPTADTPSVNYEFRVPECYFCQDRTEEVQERSVYEGKLIRVIYDRAPSVPGHLLITPKRHVDRFEDLTPDEWAEIHPTFAKVQKLFATAYKISDCLMMIRKMVLVPDKKYSTCTSTVIRLTALLRMISSKKL